jgi:hypothetical protein
MNPNRRVQDGLKQPWLCAACEERFNLRETQFATKIFHPYNADTNARLPYGPWLLKFCVSLSWRVLTIMREREWSGPPLTPKQTAQADEALRVWKDFMFGATDHPPSSWFFRGSTRRPALAGRGDGRHVAR